MSNPSHPDDTALRDATPEETAGRINSHCRVCQEKRPEGLLFTDGMCQTCRDREWVAGRRATP